MPPESVWQGWVPEACCRPTSCHPQGHSMKAQGHPDSCQTRLQGTEAP